MAEHFRVPVWPGGDYWDDSTDDVKETYPLIAPWRVCWRSGRRQVGRLSLRRSRKYTLMGGSRLGRCVGPVPLPFKHTRTRWR